MQNESIVGMGAGFQVVELEDGILVRGGIAVPPLCDALLGFLGSRDLKGSRVPRS